MATAGPFVVRDLYIYPFKSGAGIRLDEAELDAFGLVGDRRWMAVDTTGKFLTQRELPRMALITARVDAAGTLTLTAPDVPDLVVPQPDASAPRIAVVVWEDHCDGRDAGDEAARWLRAFLGVEARLVHAPDEMVRLVDRNFAQGDERVGFSDGFPLLVIGQASLDDLNFRLAARDREPAPMNRFRPSIVIDGAPPFAEDAWHRLVIGAGGARVRLDIVKPCARCSIVPVDQATGVRGVEPLATLATYRRGQSGKVYFGQNALHRDIGRLRVGDPVFVER